MQLTIEYTDGREVTYERSYIGNSAVTGFMVIGSLRDKDAEVRFINNALVKEIRLKDEVEETTDSGIVVVQGNIEKSGLKLVKS